MRVVDTPMLQGLFIAYAISLRRDDENSSSSSIGARLTHLSHCHARLLLSSNACLFDPIGQ